MFSITTCDMRPFSVGNTYTGELFDILERMKMKESCVYNCLKDEIIEACENVEKESTKIVAVKYHGAAIRSCDVNDVDKANRKTYNAVLKVFYPR